MKVSVNKKVTACIIGSGAGGGVVAKELAEKGIQVVVLEAGRRFNPLHDYTAALCDWEREGEENKRKFEVPEMDMVTFGNSNIYKPYVAYGVGGTTLRYLGYMIRLRPSDFEIYTRDGVGADWPITYEELAPYYRKVELEQTVSGQNGAPWFPPMEPYPLPPFEPSYANKIIKRGCDKLGIRLWPVPVARLSRPLDGRPACVQCGDCGNGCMTGAKGSVDVTYIRKAEATGRVEIRTESIVARIRVDAKGRARSVIYFDRNGQEHEQEAEVIILSAGTIQTPRILLNSKTSLFPDGLANSSGIVGKNFMQHNGKFSKALFPDRIDSFRGFFGGPVSFDFAETSPSHNFARGWALELHSGYQGPAKMALAVSGWGARHKDIMRKYFGHVSGVLATGEQLPDERNRIELDPTVVDKFGMPVPRITFKPRENDRLMLAAMEKNLREINAAAGASEILEMIHQPGASPHNMGTCRMGKNPKNSVVNSFCQSHDVPNLFIADGSCFVTGGSSNPGLTIMALATRAAEHIVQQGKKGGLG